MKRSVYGQPPHYLKISFHIPQEIEDSMVSCLEDLGFLGCETRSCFNGALEIDAYFDGDGKAESVLTQIKEFLSAQKAQGIAFSESEFSLNRVETYDWVNQCKANFQPIRVFPDLIILPPWETDSAITGINNIIINPGMGFGTAKHATTILCLKALRNVLRPGDSLLDFGSGNAILSIFAAKLGAMRIDAIENDKDANDNAYENLSLNELSEKIQIHQDLASVGANKYDVVVSNIDLGVVSSNLPMLLERTLSGGYLILSGIEDYEEKRFADILAGHSVMSYTREVLDGWIMAVARV